MASKGMKSFYRQKKTSSAISKEKKPSPSLTHRGSVKSPIGSDPITLVQDEEMVEEKLRGFDLDMRYGPCIGLTRMERWDRASSMGLNPPADVEAILLKVSGNDQVGPNDCLWAGRV